jgi:hypothetical protein
LVANTWLHTCAKPIPIKGTYRRLAPHEELGFVQLAIQHAPLRMSGNLKPFHEAVSLNFHQVYHWRFKSIDRKLIDLEAY